jgi:hypothetical protein
MVNNFLDANIFLELTVDESDYGEFCDKIFEGAYDRTATNRILIEVDRIKKIILNIFDKLIIFYTKNRSMDHFFSNVKISERKMDRIRDIDKWVTEYHGGSKVLRLNWLKSEFEKTVSYRLTTLNLGLIPESTDNDLCQEVNLLTLNVDDAWHITDAYSWSCSNGLTLMWSIDNDVIGPREAILTTICRKKGISRALCNFDIKHIKDII